MGIRYGTIDKSPFLPSFYVCITYVLVHVALGNELSGRGIGASVGAEQYGKDLIKLKHIINQLYNKSRTKPALVAPGGFYDQAWFAKLLQVSGSGIVNVITQHMYNLGAGNSVKTFNKCTVYNFLIYA